MYLCLNEVKTYKNKTMKFKRKIPQTLDIQNYKFYGKNILFHSILKNLRRIFIYYPQNIFFTFEKSKKSRMMYFLK